MVLVVASLAVLTHCQVHGVAASLVVLYQDHTQSGVEHATAMLPLLTHTVIADAICVKVSDSMTLLDSVDITKFLSCSLKLKVCRT